MQSVQRVVSDGTLKIVDLSISYFDRSEIAVYINSELYTAWRWASGGKFGLQRRQGRKPAASACSQLA